MIASPTDALLDSLRKQFLFRRQQLAEEVAATESALRAAVLPGQGDPSNQVEDAVRQALATSLSAEQARDIAEIALVDAALERVGTGRFGICVECDRRIPLRRLKAHPAAARCTVCQAEFERRLRHGGQ